MSCKEFRKEISLHVDGRLDGAGETRLQAHLAACPRCREALALLETAAKIARTAPTHAPGEGYWDTFSGRVMRRIESDEAAREESWWKKWAPITLPPPGKRMRFAAGVASIAVAVVAGAWFISRQGDRAILTVGQAPVERPAAVELPTPGEKETAADKGKDMLAEGRNVAGEETARPVESKAPEERVTKKDAPPPTAKEDDASSGVKTEAPGAGTKTEKAPEAAPTQLAEAAKEQPPTPRTENETLDAAATSEAPKEAPKEAPEEASKEEKLSAPVPAKLLEPAAVSITMADKRGSTTDAELLHSMRSAPVRTGADSDTTLSVAGLRAHITAWKTFIEANPADSLKEDGYREIANAYTLLAMRTGDEADIDEGARVMETDLDRSKDPATKAYLAVKLQEIQKLRKK